MAKCKHKYWLLGIISMTVGCKHMFQCEKCMKIKLSDGLLGADVK